MTTIMPIAPSRRWQAYLSLWLFKMLAVIERTPWLLRAYQQLFALLRSRKRALRKEPPPFQDLRDLQFIHFARWTLARPSDFREALQDHYLIFSTNFNGDWHQYLDAFAFTLRRGLDWIWWTSRGYPGAWPVTAFKEYARRHMLPASYYYNAYPGASVRDILSARCVVAELDKFRAALEDLPVCDPAAFRREYREFIATVQGNLGSAGVAADPATIAEHAYR